MTKISICIPTYNRATYLAELLDTICTQDSPDLEVVIADDASTDNTNAVVETYHGKIGKLRYVRHDQNLGLDGNFMAVVEHATGEFVWLMGDDDKLEPGAVTLVMQKLDEWNGIAGMTLGVIDYSSDFTRVTGIRRMPFTQVLSGIEAVAYTLWEVLGFMSALVVDRRLWLSVAALPETQDFCNYYLQLYIVGRILQRRDKWGIIQQPCVGFRSDNDQFLHKLGWLDRIELDVVAYEDIAEALFGRRSAAFSHLQEKILKSHVFFRLVNAKTSDNPPRKWRSMVRLLYVHYKNVPAFWLLAIPLILAPSWLIRNLRTVYKWLPHVSGSARARELVQRNTA